MSRVLGAVRLSSETEETTSPERQRAAIQRWAAENGHEVVGWAIDLDVSGSVAPWKRPELGKWLPATIGNEDASYVAQQAAWDESRAGDWDILCAWKLDRISRRVIDTWRLHEWCKENGKELATQSDGLDLTGRYGEMVFMLLAMFAQSELESIRDRNKSSFNELMRQGRYRGGWAPYGYRPEKMPDGKGFRFVIDEGPETLGTADVIRDVVRRVLDGESINSICISLNNARVPTPMDAQRIRAGKPRQGTKWTTSVLSGLLHSQALLGRATTSVQEEVRNEHGQRLRDRDGKVRTRRVRRLVLDENGDPVQRADALIDRETFDKLERVLAERSNSKNAALVRTRHSLLLGVAFCTCGERLYAYRGSRGTQYYRCGAKAKSGAQCRFRTRVVRQDLLEEFVISSFLSVAGRLKVVRREYVPGVDYDIEIREALASLDRLEKDRSAGQYESSWLEARFYAQHSALAAKIEDLMTRPTRPGHYREVTTGTTYRERWEALESDEERNEELRAAGLRVVLHPTDATSAEEFFDRIVTPEAETEDEAVAGQYVSSRKGRLELQWPSLLEQRIREHAARAS